MTNCKYAINLPNKGIYCKKTRKSCPYQRYCSAKKAYESTMAMKNCQILKDEIEGPKKEVTLQPEPQIEKEPVQIIEPQQEVVEEQEIVEEQPIVDVTEVEEEEKEIVTPKKTNTKKGTKKTS